MEHRHRLHLLTRNAGVSWTAGVSWSAGVPPAGRAASRRPRAGGGSAPQRDAPSPARGGGAGRRRSAVLLIVAFLALTAHARVFMTQQQALASAFPAGTKVTREVVFLTPRQIEAARKASGLDIPDKMIVRYVSPLGTAYFDTHKVRTLPETVMIVVTPDGRIDRIEILSFDEPPDYLPTERWIEQFRRRKLDDDLSTKRAIRPLSGATLSARAITNTSRKILALHHAIGANGK